MTFAEVKEYFGNGYRFHKKTGMSQMTFKNWAIKGYVPLSSQFKLQQLTNKALTATWNVAEK